MSAPCPVYGFTVTARLHPASTERDADALTADLVDLLEANGLMMRGGRRALAYVISREGSQATHADRELVIAWASRWTTVAAVEVSDLTDLEQAE